MIEVAVARTLGDFTLDVAFTGPGDGATVLFGPSGAGKSATLAAIAGAGPLTRGRVVLDGRVLADTAAGIDLPSPKRRIGWVFQDGRLFPHLRVRGNLLYGFARARGARPITIDSVVAMLDIGDLLDRGVRDLSGGERQRVALGRAILSQPDLLLLDEPLAALDAARKAEIIGFIQRLKAELHLPMVYVTHSIDEVHAIADHVVRLDRGRVAATGSAAIVAPAPVRLPAAIVRAHQDETVIRIGDHLATLPVTGLSPGSMVELTMTDGVSPAP